MTINRDRHTKIHVTNRHRQLTHMHQEQTTLFMQMLWLASEKCHRVLAFNCGKTCTGSAVMYASPDPNQYLELGRGIFGELGMGK